MNRFEFPSAHVARWEAFVASHPNPKQLREDQKIAMFRHGWTHPEQNVDEYHQALYDWQCGILGDLADFGIDPLKTVETVACAREPDDPALFRF